MTEAEICSRCVLTEAVPGVTISGGLCNFCAESTGVEAIRGKRASLAEEMRRHIEQRRGKAEYDCVVAFSGGKDSSYTLMILARDMGLKCLAITVDNGFISEQAAANCKTITSTLGVDFLTYTPAFAFMKNMYVKSMQDDGLHVRSAVRRASGICNSCINLINSYMLKTAVRHSIPIVAGGYVGGQVPQDAAVLRVNVERQRQQQSTTLDRKTAAFGPEARRHFDLGAIPEGSDPEILLINPMVTVAVSEDEIISAIAELGWQRTVDTGVNSSNCKLNDVGVAMHFRKHRFHPYAVEVSEQIRAGLMTREQGLRKVGEIPAMDELSAQLSKLDLGADAA
jgi:hypothetical protein